MGKILNGDYKMNIRVRDLTPNKSTLELAKIQDIYGGVIVVRGWR